MRKIKKTLDKKSFLMYICGQKKTMAKKKDKKEQQAIEPVANCDQFTEEGVSKVTFWHTLVFYVAMW